MGQVNRVTHLCPVQWVSQMVDMWPVQQSNHRSPELLWERWGRVGFLPELQIIVVISAAVRVKLLAGKVYLKSTLGQEIKTPLTWGHTHQTLSRSWLENQLSFFFLLNWVLDPAGKSTQNQVCHSHRPFLWQNWQSMWDKELEPVFFTPRELKGQATA